MSPSKGLRVSLIGALIFLPSVLSVLVLPPLVAGAGMLIGGALVGAGFIVTLVSYYTSGSAENED
jgi:hypothetical protein